MSELIIESDPLGAEVQIDGEVVGTTPLTLPITTSLEAFREECITDGAVSCEWETLKTRLEDQTVSRLWWDLTETERRSIAEMAIRNTLFYAIQFRRDGKPNCEGGEGAWYRPECVTNSIIRYQKFARGLSGVDSCYWTQNVHDGTEECFVPDYTYGLPCHIVSCTGVKDPHSMCSIQVVQGIDSLDNWIIFQYSDFDIKLGDPQIPPGSTVDIRIPSSFVPCSGIIWDSTVATFTDELKIFREECLSNGAVTCSWDVLKTKLEDQTVSRLWWDLTETERRSVAEMAIKNTMYRRIFFKRDGHPNCEGGTGEWIIAICLPNAAMRYAIFGTPIDGLDTCYWKYLVEDDETCYVPEYSYHLPCFIVICFSPGVGHAMCCIQVVQGSDSLDNWVIFQYRDCDIKPGDWQMPSKHLIRIMDPASFHSCGSLDDPRVVAEFTSPDWFDTDPSVPITLSQESSPSSRVPGGNNG